MKLKIEIEDNLNELVLGAIQEVKEWFSYEIENKNIEKDQPFTGGFETVDSLIDAINYNGSLNEIVDNTVPIYTHELKGLFFINEDALIEAFENMGWGKRSDFESGPLGFEGVAIYCYIEQEVNNWLSSDFETWFSAKYWSIE